MATSISEILADELTVHAVQLLKLSASMQKTLLKSLKALEQELVAKIAKIDVTGVKATTYQQARLAALLKQTRDLINSVYKKEIALTFQNELHDVVEAESRFVLDAINKSVGVDLATVALSPEVIREIAKNVLIEGAPSAEWWARQSQTLQKRFADQIRQGMLSGETIDQMVRRIRGTAARGFKDGIMQALRREAEAMVRTSVLQVSNDAYRAMYQANGDIVKGYTQLSTLDARTTLICISYSNKSWKLDGTPIGHNLPFKGGPPRHWNCRSVLIPLLRSWQELGRRDAIRTGTEKGGGRPTSITRFFNQRLKAKGFSAADIAQIKMDTRASMDGQVADSLSFDEWLRRKEGSEPGFADKLLGKGKADLWRRGQITLEDLLDMRGNPLTLEELRAEMAGVEKVVELPGAVFEHEVRTLEQTIASKKDREVGFVFNDKGEIIFRKEGDSTFIRFTEEEGRMMENLVFTHNHPNGAPPSDKDLYFAIVFNLREMHATGVTGLGNRFSYKIIRPPGGWFTREQFSEIWNKELTLVKYEFDLRYVSKEINLQEYQQDILHEVWLRIAKKLGFRYERIKI